MISSFCASVDKPPTNGLNPTPVARSPFVATFMLIARGGISVRPASLTTPSIRSFNIGIWPLGSSSLNGSSISLDDHAIILLDRISPSFNTTAFTSLPPISMATYVPFFVSSGDKATPSGLYSLIL